MRTLVVTENITLDGVIDATEGWFAPADGADIDQSDLNVYRLFVYPVVVGRGARLFDDATDVGRLRLLECRPFHSGVVLTRYTANE